MEKRLPKSVRKFIRIEKARIRREFLDLKKQKELINELYLRISKNSKPDGSKPLNIKPKIRKTKKEAKKQQK